MQNPKQKHRRFFLKSGCTFASFAALSDMLFPDAAAAESVSPPPVEVIGET